MFLMFDDESDGSSDSEDEISNESCYNNLHTSCINEQNHALIDTAEGRKLTTTTLREQATETPPAATF